MKRARPAQCYQEAVVASSTRKWIAFVRECLLDGRIGIPGVCATVLEFLQEFKGELVWTCRGHSEAISDIVALSGTEVASASLDGTIRIWDSGSGTKILRGHTDAVRALALLGDGLLASSSEDCSIRVWDTKTCACTKVLSGHKTWVTALAAFPDGRLVSAAQNVVWVWDVATETVTRVYKGHKYCVAVLPVGNDAVLAGCGNGDIRKWTGTDYTVFKGHNDWVSAIRLAPDGFVVSASFDATVRTWDFDTGRCLHTYTCDNVPFTIACFASDRFVVPSKLGLAIFVDRGKVVAQTKLGGTVEAIAILHNNVVAISGGCNLNFCL